jgi:hypothetical protein
MLAPRRSSAVVQSHGIASFESASDQSLGSDEPRTSLSIVGAIRKDAYEEECVCPESRAQP